MVTPLTPPEASIPLPASRRASPTSTPQSRLGVSNLDDRRLSVRSPLRSASLPVSAAVKLEAAKSQARDARISSHLRTETSASTPASVSIKGDHQLKRPLIVRSTTSTSTLFRDGSSSVPPPMSRGRYDPEGENRVEPDEGEDDEVDDFYKERVLTINEPVGSLSISPSSRDLCLASRKGLFIMDLNVVDQVPRYVPQGGMWQVADCQWSPHPATSNLILTTSAQKLLLWDLCSTSPSTCLSRVIEAHERGITDINWHARDPHFMATTSIDGSVKGWDIRVKDSDRAVMRLADWGDAATQVKWNRQHDHILASSHDNRLNIWDTRKGAIPITSFQAHDDRMYGIDWDRRSRHQIVSCSLDKTIKYWSIDDMSYDKRERYQHKSYFPSLPAPSGPTSIIRTKHPVWRARNLPFGRGVLSVPQRGACALEMWGRDQDRGPIERFEEYTAPVKEFVWRTRGGNDADHEDREFQLITWSKDRQLRMIPIQRDLLARAGYRKGAPIDLLVSRRNAPNISYATWDPPPLPALSAKLRAAEEIASGATTVAEPSPTAANFPHKDGVNRLPPFRSRSDSLAPFFLVKPSIRADDTGIRPTRSAAKTTVMTRGSVGRSGRKRKAIDQLEWLGGVTTIRREGKGEISVGSSLPASHRTSRLASTSRKGSDSGSHSVEGFPGTPGGPLSFSLRGFMADRRGSVQLDLEEDENLNIDLADEIRQVKVGFPRAKFESQNLDFRKRQCAVSLRGPWGDGARLVYTRVLFRFPSGYPRKAGPAGCPAFKLIARSEISPETYDTMKRKLQDICEEQRPALAACISYLLGYNETQNRIDSIEPDSDSESDIEFPTQKHVLDKRSCGMSWGPNGELVTFFAKNVQQASKRSGSLPHTPLGNTSKQLSLGNGAGKGNSALLKAMSALSRLSDMKHDKHRKRQAQLAGFSFAEGIQKAQMISADGSILNGAAKPQNRMLGAQQKPSSVLRLSTHVASPQPCRRLAECYRTSGGTLAVQSNLEAARQLHRPDHELIWKLIASSLAADVELNQVKPPVEPVKPPRFNRKNAPTIHCPTSVEDHPAKKRNVDALSQIVKTLVASRDLQLLATIVSVFIAMEEEAPRDCHGSRARQMVKNTEMDYFNSREPSRSKSEAGSSYQTPRAPSPSLVTPYLQGLSSNFSQFLPFSNSLVSSHGFGDRERRVSESPSWVASTDVRPLPVPMSNSLRMPNRSASPRRDSFRQQLFGKPPGSPHDSNYAGSMRSMANDSSPGDSNFAANSRITRVSFGSGAAAPDLSRRSDTQSGSTASTANLQSSVKHWHTSVWLSTSPTYDSWAFAWQGLIDDELLRLAYADLLLRWGLVTTRTELLLPIKHASSSHPAGRDIAHDSLTTLSICGKCNYEIGDDVDRACSCSRGRPPACVFCRLPVKGVAVACTLCLHIQHASCAKLASVVTLGQSATGITTCPMGCDCACVLGGFNGAMEVQDNGLVSILSPQITPTELDTPLAQPLELTDEAIAKSSENDTVKQVTSSRTLGMFAKAQMRNLGDFSHYFSHTN